MTETIKFHLDEQVNNAIAKGLRQRGIDVTTTSEAGLISASDEIQLQFAYTQGRVIFTQDDDFLKLNYRGFPHAGIVYCQQNTRSIGEILRSLILIWEYVEAEDMVNCVEYI